MVEPDIDEQENFYNHFWKNRTSQLIPDEILRLSFIIKNVAYVKATLKNKPLRICDLGCGRGWLSEELSQFGTVTAVDLSTLAIEAANKTQSPITFVAHDILNWRPETSFDLVVSSEVIEHITDQEKYIETVRYLLRNDGYLILTTPNGKVKKIWDAEVSSKQPVENWVTPPELRKLLHGFDITDHDIFYLDFSLRGIFRLICAPKVHRALSAIGLIRPYNFLRSWLGLGLYQVICARYTNPS